MGADDDTRAGRGQSFDMPPHFLMGYRIQTRCRLIEQDEARGMQQRRGKLHPAHPSLGERSRPAARPWQEAESVDRGLDGCARISQPINFGAESEVFKNREVGIER